MNKYINKKNIIYVIEFIIFCILIYKAPVVGDRWMEKGTGVVLEHPLRIIFTQIRWFQEANGRIFSNLFSFLVDGYSIHIRIIVNSFMLTAISWMINHIADSRTVVAVIIPFSISFGGWVEVYFYATTFYVSAAFILVAWLYFERKGVIDRAKKRNMYLFCFFAIISSMWAENLSITLCLLWASIALYKLWKKEEYAGHFLICLSGIFGTVLMFLSALFATKGRLKSSSVNKMFIDRIREFGEILSLEYILFILLSIVILRILFRGNDEGKKPHKTINMCIWIIIFITNILQLLQRAYRLVSSDPLDDSYNMVSGWRNFESISINNFIGQINNSIPFLNIAMFVVGLVSLIYLTNQYCSKYKPEIYFLIFIDVFCSLITIQTMYQRYSTMYAVYQDARILYIFEIITGIIIFLFYVQIENENKLKEQIIVLLFVLYIFWCQYAFIEPYSLIALERGQNAELVKQKQELKEWDYVNDIMYFPSYKKNNAGDSLIGFRYNPEMKDVYYILMLKYYDLDEKTIIVYD